MAKFDTEPQFNFDDVLLKPKYSNITSRSLVNTKTRISYIRETNHELKINAPIISANMDTITGENMIRAMNKSGATGILHRFQPTTDILNTIHILCNEDIYPIIPSVGVDSDAVEDALAYLRAGAHAICVDIAHGHSEKMLQTVTAIKVNNPHAHIIAGNIATIEAASALIEAGASALKVGIGPGYVCKTRVETGIGFPQLSAIAAVALIANRLRIPVIADGGIRYAGDITKALAAGASAVMIGSLFAGTNEALGGNVYRGMASADAQIAWKGKAKNIEGITVTIESKGPVEPIIEHLMDGVRSGMSYCGSHNIEELWTKAEFVRAK